MVYNYYHNVMVPCYNCGGSGLKMVKAVDNCKCACEYCPGKLGTMVPKICGYCNGTGRVQQWYYPYYTQPSWYSNTTSTNVKWDPKNFGSTTASPE